MNDNRARRATQGETSSKAGTCQRILMYLAGSGGLNELSKRNLRKTEAVDARSQRCLFGCCSGCVFYRLHYQTSLPNGAETWHSNRAQLIITSDDIGTKTREGNRGEEMSGEGR